MTQGKRKDQIDFSSRMGFIGFVGVTLCFIWGMTFMPDPPPPTEGIPHNYYHPKVWGESDTLSIILEEPIYGPDTTHVITEDGINWYTTDSQDDGDTLGKDTLLKNYWIPNTQLKIKNIK